MESITREKIRQAKSLLAQSTIDVWLTFVRETSVTSDPVLEFIFEGGLTWQSALLITKAGKTIAVVGNYDADPVRSCGDWDVVVPYVQGIKEELLRVLEDHVTIGGKIAVNYSHEDVHSDGLGHGMYLLLQSYLMDTRFEGALVSAENITMQLRGVKSESECDRIRTAIAETNRIFDEVGESTRIGQTEAQVFASIQETMQMRGLGFAWDMTADPIVNSGPNSMIGHGYASDQIRLEPGHIFHIDLGVIKNGYASDIQRCWYVSAGEDVPSDVLRAMDAVNEAISSAAKILKPGVLGHEVDAAARRSLVASGYEEYLHALGHQVGRVAHDGGALLGPAWDRYGRTPFIPVRSGEIYTLELGVVLPNRGYLGLEEMVRVTDVGIEWLTKRQQSIPVIRTQVDA